MTANVNTPSRTPPRISANDASFATIIVGATKTKFVVHEQLLTYHSPFFRAALEGHFKEAETKTVPLEDEEPQTFEFFVHWLYHQRLPRKDDAPGLFAAWGSEVDDGDLKTENLISLYVFCDAYDVQTLKDSIMSEMFYHMKNKHVVLPSVEQVNFAFDKLQHHSPLCRYLVDSFCYYAHESVWEDFAIEHYRQPFLSKVMQQYTIFAIRERFKPVLCIYHEHLDGAGWEACKPK